MEPMGNHRFQVGSSRSHGGLLDQGIWNLCGECHTCTSIYVAQTLKFWYSAMCESAHSSVCVI